MTYIKVVGVPHARVCSHEEDENSGSQEDGNNAADGLGVELLVRGGLEEETDTEVANKTGSDISSS